MNSTDKPSLKNRKKNRKRKKRTKKESDPAHDENHQRSQNQHRKMNAASEEPVARPKTLHNPHQIQSKTAQVFNNRNPSKKRQLSQDLEDPVPASFTKEVTRPRYCFDVDDTDHCETPLQAYKDLLTVLDELVKSLNKERSTLKIYDPYYCDGGVKKKLSSYGFNSVINQNRNFYDDIENKSTPEYDILVTNPPYSGFHMEKLLDFCDESARSQKPFLLLLPHFVYTKDYYKRALSSELSAEMFFLVPEMRYAYIPPAWVEAKMGSLIKKQVTSKNIVRGYTCRVDSVVFNFTTNRLLGSQLIENFYE